MTFITRLFGRKDNKAVEPLHGAVTTLQTETEHLVHRATRTRMEAEVARDRARRGADDVRPVDSDR